MRLVGLVLLGMGSVIVWDVFRGRNPIDHLKQLAQLFGHQQAQATTPVITLTPFSPSLPSTLPQLV